MNKDFAQPRPPKKYRNDENGGFRRISTKPVLMTATSITVCTSPRRLEKDSFPYHDTVRGSVLLRLHGTCTVHTLTVCVLHIILLVLLTLVLVRWCWLRCLWWYASCVGCNHSSQVAWPHTYIAACLHLKPLLPSCIYLAKSAQE